MITIPMFRLNKTIDIEINIKSLNYAKTSSYERSIIDNKRLLNGSYENNRMTKKIDRVCSSESRLHQTCRSYNVVSLSVS